MTEKFSGEESKRRIRERETDCTEFEKKLLEARSLAEDIMTYMTEGLVLTDPRGRIVFINQRLSEMLGYLPDEITGRCWLEMVPAQQQAIAKQAEARRANGHIDRYEIVLRHKNGRKFPVMIGAGPRFDRQTGEFIGTMGVVTDITQWKKNEKMLREKESFSKAVMENLPIGIAVNSVDPEVEFSYMNDNFPKIYRTTREALSNPDTFWDTIYEDPVFRRKIRNRVMTDCASGDPDRMHWEDIPFTRKGDGPFYICARNVPLKGSKMMISTVWDVTERKRAEEEMVKEAARRRILMEQSRDGIVIVDQAGQVIEANQRFADMLGYPLESMSSLKIFDWEFFFPPERIIDILDSVDETGDHFETRHRRSDGSVYDVEISTNAAWFDGKKLVFCICRDISERKQAEQSLAESQARFKALHNASFGGIAVHDQGIILECNQGLSEMTGYEYSELIGMNGLLLIAEKSRQTVMKNIRAGYEKPYEAFGLRKNGEEFPLQIEARNVPYKGKQVRTVELRDISDRKRAEEERGKLQAQLFQAQKMESVGRLAGGVAHDFNNMLGVILGHAELGLLQADENHDLHANLKEIQTAAIRSADIIKQLLAFARKQTISPRKLDLNAAVENTLNMLRRLIGENIDLVWQPDPHLWPVKMDLSQIDQILANLCVNARDAITGPGNLTIETGNCSVDETSCNEFSGVIPGDFVMMTVSDDGCGMDKETLNNLFEPFFTTKDIGEGTGLGLATVYGIVKQNGGFISVYSEPNHGSTFKIYLPRYVSADDPPAVVYPDKPVPIGNETILLVEDEPAILRMTQMMLEQKGYSVLPAATPAEAIDLASTHADKIHLLMTDVVMPEMNGRELAGQLISLCPDIKLLFMSGYTANVIVHQGVLDEEVAFIQKPFSMKGLAEKVRGVLDKTTQPFRHG